MKIALISPNYPPESGACSARISYMARRLVQEGHQVHVITALPNYPTSQIFEEYRHTFSLTETQDNITISRYWIYPSHSPSVWLRGFNMLSLAFSVLFSVQKLRKFRPDWILVQSPPLFLAFSGCLLAKIVGAKLILNISDLFPRTLKDLGKLEKGLLYNFFEKIEKFLYHKTDICLAQSEEIIVYIKEINPNINIFLYRTGVDCDIFLPKKEHQSQKFRFIYAGMLGIAQGIFDLCQQINFEALGAELHIYGEGFEKIKIKEFLEKNKFIGIFLHEIVSQEEIANYLQQFDGALVVQKTKILGTFPSKIYEAMASGLPILHVGGGESAEIIQKMGAGLVAAPQNFEQIKEKLKEMIEMSPEKRKILSENGRKAAVEFFDRKKQFENFLKILDFYKK